MGNNIEIFDELIMEEALELESHLEDIENNKILFSGKFGKGKSTFLHHFFDKQEKYLSSKTKKYEVIHISPVSYTIASNEDIIKYIKYDIIYELIKKNIEVESYDFTNFEVLPDFLNSNFKEIVTDILPKLLEFIPHLGKPVKTLAETIFNLYNKLDEFKNQINDESPSDKLVQFLDSIKVDTKSIYENDKITKLIESIILELKEKIIDDNIKDYEAKYKYETVLIIDDLDRIDPEHIFRILNVFSTHFESYEREGKLNKFGFDKIVLVCDINNIRSIFSHKYGGDADFSGYIDKFYSKEIYHFNNYNQLKKIILEIIGKYKLEIGTNPIYSLKDHKNSHNQFPIGISDLITILIDNNLISLRSVIGNINTVYHYNTMITLLEKNDINSHNHLFHIEIDIVTKLLGGYYNFEKVINKLILLKIEIPNTTLYCTNLIYYLTSNHHKFKGSQDSFFSLQNEQIKLSFESSKGIGPINHKVSKIETNGGHGYFIKNFTSIEYFNLLSYMLKDLHNNKFIN